MEGKRIPLVRSLLIFLLNNYLNLDLVKKIIRTIQEANIHANLIQFEITETGFIEITPKLINELATLNAFGIKLIIDDFGTGYSDWDI